MSASSSPVDPFVAQLAAEWQKLLGSAGQKQAAVAPLGLLAPLLANGLSELTRALEREQKERELHEQLAKKNGALRPRPPFDPLHFLASYLMQHNPKYKAKPAKR